MLQDLELSNTVTPNPGNEALQIPIVTSVPAAPYLKLASYSVPFSFQQHNHWGFLIGATLSMDASRLRFLPLHGRTPP